MGALDRRFEHRAVVYQHAGEYYGKPGQVPYQQ
jgi:hypothetical protein